VTQYRGHGATEGRDRAPIRREIRLWRLQRRSDKNLDDLARIYGPYIRGWINYYSHF